MQRSAVNTEIICLLPQLAIDPHLSQLPLWSPRCQKHLCVCESVKCVCCFFMHKFLTSWRVQLPHERSRMEISRVLLEGLSSASSRVNSEFPVHPVCSLLAPLSPLCLSGPVFTLLKVQLVCNLCTVVKDGGSLPLCQDSNNKSSKWHTLMRTQTKHAKCTEYLYVQMIAAPI